MCGCVSGLVMCVKVCGCVSRSVDVWMCVKVVDVWHTVL